MRGNKLGMMGFVMIVGVATGMAWAQEPALDVKPPDAAPLLDTESAPVAATAASTNATPAPAVKPHAPAVDPAPAATNVPVAEPAAPVVPLIPVVAPVPAESAAIPEETGAAAWHASDWQIGTRYLEVQFQESTRGTPGNDSFFGTITEISEEQDGWPNKVYLQYRISKSPVWIGISYDHVRARTMDDGDGDGVPDLAGGDGSEDLQGVIPYVQAVWENDTRLSPFVQVGFGFYQAEFQPNSWGNNGQRYVETKGNVTGVELAGGLNVRLYKELSADIFAKYMQIQDIEGDWYFNYGNNYGGPFVMTMSYVAYGAGLNWRF